MSSTLPAPDVAAIVAFQANRQDTLDLASCEGLEWEMRDKYSPSRRGMRECLYIGDIDDQTLYATLRESQDTSGYRVNDVAFCLDHNLSPLNDAALSKAILQLPYGRVFLDMSHIHEL